MKCIKLKYFVVFILLSTSCNKSTFLDEKSDQSLIVPETLDELQAILDNNIIMNGVGEGVVPSLGQIGCDDYWLTNFPATTTGSVLKEIYLWTDNYQNTKTKFYEWDFPFRGVFYSNIVLDGLAKMDKTAVNTEAYNNAYGSALFFRSHMFYQLAQVFSPPYDKSTLGIQLGIPLKLKSDINEKVNRSTISETYDQIIKDLKIAINFLPVSPKYITRPSKPAAYGLLSRTYLLTQKYDSALLYASKCLELKNVIKDYNYPFTDINSSTPCAPRFSCEEIIFHSKIIDQPVSTIMYSTVRTRVDSNLYKSYDPNDLRKSAYFVKRPVGVSFKGSYEGDNQLFGGIATDEVYLIRAECNARLGKTEEALSDLNKLMEKRWLSSAWVPFKVNDANEALKIILTERRKELLFRGLRWTDIRRLNMEGAMISQSRIADGQVYELAPNSKKYTFLIPNDVLSFHPDWSQNPR